MKLLEFAFSSLEYFLGCFIILSVLTSFVIKLVNRIMRHINIFKHGYPPAHCDADGDFKVEKEKDTDE